MQLDIGPLYNGIACMIGPGELAIDGILRDGKTEPLMHKGGGRCDNSGEFITQIGIGMGYYSAILARLVSPGGILFGIEFNSGLAEIARQKLAAMENVTIVNGDATAMTLADSDIIYVSAGVAELPLQWLTALRPGGRLIFPWRPSDEVAMAMLISRQALGFAAKPLAPAWFIPCIGAATTDAGHSISNLSQARNIQSLHFIKDRQPDASTVIAYREFWFSSDAV